MKTNLTLCSALIFISLLGCGDDDSAPDASGDTIMTDTAAAPSEFTVEMTLTTGVIQIDVDRSLSPIGADRFFSLVETGFFTDIAFFRVVDNFVVQFGIHGDPSVSSEWRNATIEDDPVVGTNSKGTLTFATSGPDSRTTQMFINLSDNASLDGQGFSPFGTVRDMTNVEAINNEYAERPDQSEIQSEGNTYLRDEFPNLDYIVSAKILP